MLSPILAQSSDEGLSGVGESLTGASWEQWLTAGIVVGVALVAGRVLRAVIVRVLSGEGDTGFGARIVGRIVMYAVVVFGFVYALSALSIPLGPLFGALGVAGIALAFALQDILENFMAGIILLLRRPFEVGDQIETSDFEGTVEDINLRTVALRQFDGTTVYIPNATVLDSPIVNNTERGVRRTTFDLGVGYETDLDEAQKLIVGTISSLDGVEGDPAPQAFVKEFGDNSINFAVRYWHQPEKAREWEVRDTVARRLKRELDGVGIDLPFPQRVIHHKGVEAPVGATSHNGSGS